MENEKYLEMANYFEHLLLNVFVGNDITILILGELELLCNFMIEFNHYKIKQPGGELPEQFLTACMNGLSLTYL